MTSMPSAHSTPLRVAGVALFLVLTVCSCTADGAGAERSSNEHSAPAVDTQGSGAATASEEIGQFAGERFPKLFAQVSVEGESVVVHRVRTDGSPLDTAVRKQFPAHPVRFADAPRSATELDALTRRVVDDHRTLKAEGIRVDAVGPDYVRGIVIVNVENPASARTALTERYGKALRVSAPGPDVLPAG